MKKYILLVLCLSVLIVPTVNAETQQGSIGVEGKISSPPPTQPAVIISPTNGRVFTQTPIDVTGSCPNGLLVKLFKNNVFSGSANCAGGSFTITIDLFSGQNDLVARVYDALDQAGPDSNTVTVQYNDPRSGIFGPRVTLTSNYAKRGAFPKEKLSFPIILSGGTGPYAISVQWGDGTPADLFTQLFPGTFDITHAYDSPGVYNIVVKAVDTNGVTAFLQLVGVCNGPLSDGGTTINAQGQEVDSEGRPVSSTTGGRVERRIIWQPAVISIPLILSTFWLGRRHALYVLRRRIEKGERAFR